MYWTESMGRIELNITKAQALTGAHAGRCDDDIAHLRTVPTIRRQLDKLAPALVAAHAVIGAWAGIRAGCVEVADAWRCVRD